MNECYWITNRLTQLLGRKTNMNLLGLRVESIERATRLFLKITGITEAAVNEVLKDLYQDNP